jgi:hypothetical protein
LLVKFLDSIAPQGGAIDVDPCILSNPRVTMLCCEQDCVPQMIEVPCRASPSFFLAESAVVRRSPHAPPFDRLPPSCHDLTAHCASIDRCRSILDRQ